MGEYAAEDILSGAAMNDMARYLGALYRFDNGTTVKSITYGDTEFTWSNNLDPALKGSNWVKILMEQKQTEIHWCLSL